jgi:hypothetical protein
MMRSIAMLACLCLLGPALAAEDIDSRLSALEAEVAQLKAQEPASSSAQDAAGLKLGLKSTMVYQQLLGQGGEGAASRDLGAGTGSLDLLLDAAPLPWALAHVDLNVGGYQGIDCLVSSDSKLNATWRSEEVEMVAREAYATFKAGGTADLSLGLLDPADFIDENSLAGDETSSFLAGLFVSNPVLEPPTHGAGLLATVGSELLRAKVLAINAQNTAVDPASSVFMAAELASAWNTASGAGGLRIWGRRRPVGADGEANALGLSADQSLGPWGIFARFAKAWYPDDEAISADAHDWALSAGLVCTGLGLRAGDPASQDSLGLAWGQDSLMDGDQEQVVEARYCLPLGAHLLASLHYQALYSRLQDGKALEPAQVLGSRLTLSY